MRDDETERPIRRVLSKLKNVKRSGPGHTAQCPAHPDKQNSLGIDEIDGNCVLKCHAGCATEDVVAAIQLTMRDLFARSRDDAQPRERKQVKSLTLDELCKHKKLSRAFVCGLGWREYSSRNLSRVEIPYVQRDGKVHRVRHRFALIAKEGSSWSQPGDTLIAYEPDKGALAQQEGWLLIVEGETDTVTCLSVGIPALGIPGATQEKTLEAHHVADLKHVFVCQETDAAGEQFVVRIQKRLTDIGFEGAVHIFRTPNAAKDPNTLYIREPEKFLELMHGAFVEASKPPPEPLDDVWKTLGEWGSLVNAPPARRWLLERPDDECNGARNIGVFPMGKVGMLVSAGGVGKTMALCQLSLSLATGCKWFNHYTVCQTGRVLLALGEEDREEIWRRMFQAAGAMRLTDAQLELAATNIVAMPLAGRSVALVEGSAGVATPTAMLEAMRKRLDAERGWVCIIMDPLSRFAGMDTEKDNSAATRFIEVAESLIRSPGGPSVLLAHHTNKTSRTDGSTVNAAHARGASGLTDGARWQANLESAGPDTVNFEVTKSNYAPYGPAVRLVRDADHGGFLRVQSPAEQTQRLEKISEKASARKATMREAVIKAVAENLGMRSGNDIFKIIKGNRPAVLEAFRELKQEGWLELKPEGLSLSERSGLNG